MKKQYDAKTTIFFEKQLEQVMTKVFEKEYPALKMANGDLLPITSEIDPGAESALYRTYDEVGMAKIISNYADDLPMNDVRGTEETVKIKSLGDAFQYNIQEVKRARLTGVSLQTMRAVSARNSIEQLINKLAWYGDEEYGMVGILNHPNIPVTIHTGTKIAVATAQEMYDLVSDSIDALIELTNGMEIPDTVVLPLAEYQKLNKTLMGANADYSVLNVLKRNYAFITKWDWALELKNVDPRPSGTGGSANCMLIYKRDAEKARLEIPLQLEQLAPEPRNLATIVNLHSRFAGFITLFPLSLSIVEDI